MPEDNKPATPADENKKEETAQTAPEKTAEPAEKKAEEKESSIKLSKEAQKILDAVKELKALDLANLVKSLEKEFGVSAAAQVAVAAAGTSAGSGDAGDDEEKSSFSVEFTAAGGNKIAAIKAVKAITGQGLGEAKATVENAPKVLKENVPKEEAEEMKKKLEEAGCTATLK
jgi:large subunit ribosomal protein L7/L12